MKCSKCEKEFLAFKGLIDREKKILSILYMCSECMSVKNVDINIVEHFDFKERELNDSYKNNDEKRIKHNNNILYFNSFFNDN
jgi:hypothetical protein